MSRTAARPDACSIVGSSRDRDVLASLAWVGLLTTSQLQRLHFPSRRRAQRRLRALLDHGLVRAHLQGEALHKENVYTLAPKGLELLLEEGSAEDGARLRRIPRPGKLPHAIAIRDVFVAFMDAEARGAFMLDDFRFDDDLAGEPIFKAARLVPDALALVRMGNELRAIGIEVDLGTETRATLAAKCEAWRSILANPAAILGTPRARLLFVVDRNGRRSTIARVLGEAELTSVADVMLFRDIGDYLRRP